MTTARAVNADIFREYDIRGLAAGAGAELDAGTAYAVGGAFAVMLADDGVRGLIAVGRDNRPSGAELHDALLKGLTESGIDVVDIGLVPTPGLYWALERLGVAGGIQITASHNPAEYNGFKVCVGTRALFGDDIQRLLQIIQQGRHVAAAKPGSVQQKPILDDYVEDLVERIGAIHRPLSIVMDCMNGVGSMVMPRVLDRLGVKYQCLRCESEGTFPNGQPDPSAAKNLTALIAAVKASTVDAGLAVDGDADRVGVIDAHGDIVWGDRVLAIYARDVLAKPANKGKAVIFDVKSSQALEDAITAAGGKPVMWKTGHSLIEAKMRELGAPLAGELSGHMYIADGYYGFDDAIYAAGRLLRIMGDTGKSIHELLAGVPVYPVSPEIRVACPDETKFAIVAKAVAHWKVGHRVIDVDGARVVFDDGWGLIRASNTEPALVLRFEARTTEQLNKIQGEMESWLREQGVAI
jgi:phosphomannomutase/phosphoglucomutase